MIGTGTMGRSTVATLTPLADSYPVKTATTTSHSPGLGRTAARQAQSYLSTRFNQKNMAATANLPNDCYDCDRSVMHGNEVPARGTEGTSEASERHYSRSAQIAKRPCLRCSPWPHPKKRVVAESKHDHQESNCNDHWRRFQSIELPCGAGGSVYRRGHPRPNRVSQTFYRAVALESSLSR